MSTLIKSVKSFCTTQANAPAKGLALFVDAIDHMLAIDCNGRPTRDSDPLAYFLGHAPSAMRGVARLATGKLVEGIQLDTSSKLAKAHQNKCKVIQGQGPAATILLDKLRSYVGKKDDKGKPYSLTHSEVKELFVEEKDPERWTDKILEKKAKAIVEAALQGGVLSGTLIAAIQAYALARTAPPVTPNPVNPATGEVDF